MTTTPLLTRQEETALAVAVEIGVLAEEALRGGFAVTATAEELDTLVVQGRAARAQLLLANIGLVKAIARAELGASPMEIAELFQEGFLAMAEAVMRYDHRRGGFGPYAAAWIRSGVRVALATQCGRAGVPARDMARYFAIRRAETDLMQCLGRSVTVSEVPGASGQAAILAILSPAPYAAAFHVADETASRHVGPDTTSDLLRLVERLPVQDRRILTRRFGFEGPPVTRDELARELGVSEATVRRAEARALDMLRRGLERLAAA